MLLKRLPTSGLAINSYVAADSKTKEGVVIDPTRDTSALLQFINLEEITITHIFETHVHADFVSGAKELKHQLNDRPLICCSGLGGPEWVPHYADKTLEDREEILIGSLHFQIWHTPGHTPEHIMLVVSDDARNPKIPSLAFTGDFLFVGSVGRPDLLGDENLEKLSQQLYDSVFHILPQLPDYLEIYPAHSAGSVCGSKINSTAQSTLGYERLANPLLQPRDEDSWIQLLLQNMPKIPGYFARLKKWNVLGVPLVDHLPIPKKLSLREISEKSFILDARSQEEFAAKHVPNSINLGFWSSLNKWLPQLVPYDPPIYVIIKEESQLSALLAALHLVGLDHVAGFATFTSDDLTFTSFPLANPETIAKQHEEMPDKMCILDVRTQAEWDEGHLKDATHIDLSDLGKSMHLLSWDKQIAVICGTGYRSSAAASLLQKEGFKNVCNIKGGMQGWKKAQLPVVTK